MGRLFWKIFFAFWLTLIAAAIGTGMAISLQREDRDGPAPELAAGRIPAVATELASATLRHGGVPALREWMRESQRTRGPSLFAVDSEGRDLLGRPVPAAALTRARELAAGGGARAAREVAAPGGERYLLFMPLEGEPRRGRRPGPPPPTWLLVLIGAGASLAVSALLAWYLSRPIRSLRWAFRSAAQGRLDTRVRPLMKGRSDEIADLGDDFDQMAQQLQKLVGAQRRLLHDVSHELRSPLARLQAAIGLVRQSPEKLEASLDRIEREVARLDELVGEVLTLARLETGATGPAAQTVDLAELVADIAEDARFEAEAAKRRLSLRVRQPGGGAGKRRASAPRGRERGAQRRQVHRRRQLGRGRALRPRRQGGARGRRPRPGDPAGRARACVRAVLPRGKRHRQGVRPRPRDRAARGRVAWRGDRRAQPRRRRPAPGDRAAARR